MNKTSIPFILFVIMLASCATPKTEISPTQIPATPTQLPTATAIVMPFIGDGGLISDKPCAAPCFFGIRIGETMLSQTISILEKNGIHSCIQDGATEISCGNIIVGANSSTVIVDGIGYLPSSTVTVGDVIKKHGSPDIINVIPTGIPEHPTITIFLFFDILRMKVYLPVEEKAIYTNLNQAKFK